MTQKLTSLQLSRLDQAPRVRDEKGKETEREKKGVYSLNRHKLRKSQCGYKSLIKAATFRALHPHLGFSVATVFLLARSLSLRCFSFVFDHSALN